MKKLIIYLAVILALFAVIFLVNQLSDNASNEENALAAEKLYETSPDNLDPATRDQLNDPNYQSIILPKALDQKLEAESDMFVYFFSPTCIHCQRTTPILSGIIADQQVDIHQYNLLEFREGWQKFNIHYTPTLVYFKDGKEVNRFVGGIEESTKDKMIQFIEEYKNQT